MTSLRQVAGVLLLMLTLVLIPSTTLVAQLGRKGGEFRINSSTTGEQLGARVAALADGGFLVVWQGTQGEEGASEIRGRRFLSGGEPEGEEFLIGAPTSHPGSPDVAGGEDGSAFVVWSVDRSPFIVGRKLAPDGTLSDEQVIPDPEFPLGSGARVAPLDAGEFVVVWRDFSDRLAYLTRGRRIGSTGVPSGSSFSVTGDTAGLQYNAAVAGPADGSFVVVWLEEPGHGSDEAAIVGRQFERDEPQAADFVIGPEASSYRLDGPEVCASEEQFVVTWATYIDPSSSNEDHPVLYRRYDRNGAALTPPVRVSPEVPAPKQNSPALTCGPDDGFILAWTEARNIIGRTYSAGGISGFRVALEGIRSISAPSLARISDVDFVLTWSDCLEEARCDLFGQIFTSAPVSHCAGDCNGDGVVHVDELVTGVRAALAGLPALTRQCLPLDSDLNYFITIDELVAAVKRALNACPPA